MDKLVVALMQPCAGRAAPWRDAVKAFLRPSRRNIERLEIEQGTTSTPRTFNMAYCEALNGRKQHGFNRASMLHDDICPCKDGADYRYDWLDVLCDELDATGCDFLSAAVPIRDDRGLISTAVDMHDPWSVRRLTLTELFALPETFRNTDIPWNKHGGALLPNTGLWVMRFDQPWAEKLKFRFVNDIRQSPSGQWHSVDLAEDWDLGRQMAALGLDVRVTRKVPLMHGEPRYHTISPWGQWPTDLGYLQYTAGWAREAAGLTEDNWRFPEDVEGWLSEEEGRGLAGLARDKTVLEIGSYCGRSTVCMAQTATALIAVDPFDGRATTKMRFTLSDFMENLVKYGVAEKVTTIRGASQVVVAGLKEKFDLAFIDGAHDAPSVKLDASLATAALAPGGLLAFHDFRNFPGEHDGNWDPGVTQTVNELIAQGASLVDKIGTIAVVRPAA